MTGDVVLRSVQVGTPHRYGGANDADDADGARGANDADGARGRSWETSFVRAPSAQPRWLYTTHLDGNAQADTKNHGRPDQAVLLYAAAHYPAWRPEVGRTEIGPGGFGENFTVDGLTEETACVGDTYAIGEALIEVTGPRYPCWKIERRWNIAGLTARVAETGRTGWYCRVLREGLITPGASVAVVERPYPRWTIALTNSFAHGGNADVETARALAACPRLNEWWRRYVMQWATGAR